MHTPTSILAFGVAAATLVVASPAAATGPEASFEAGLAVASRNDARIPGAGGTKLSLSDELTAGATPAFRLRLGYRFGDRHLLTALYAPLRVTSRGRLTRSVDFAGASFAPGEPVSALYRFDSYRLTYRYSLLRDEAVTLGVGFTGKIRDAEIALQGGELGRKTNTGFVPLLHLHLDWRPWAGPFGLLLDADALAAPQGRAEDVLVAVTWRASEPLGLRVGYRMLEGGADNDEVYNFAWIHYGVVGADLRW
jgi:hypothetical protein